MRLLKIFLFDIHWIDVSKTYSLIKIYNLRLKTYNKKNEADRFFFIFQRIRFIRN
jgi:hypothetical protein